MSELLVDTLRCVKCSKIIPKTGNYAITVFLVKNKLSDPYYEHLCCPEKFSMIC
ncbi:MAG: hypothetical protein HZB73_05605 [Nitrosarchaeum sp.]|nr:hypothetical protein [Nitrosarchaeum sp.]